MHPLWWVITTQFQQALPNPALDAAVEQIQKGNLLAGLMLAGMSAFFLLLGYVLIGQRREITSLKEEMVKFRTDLDTWQAQQAAVNLAMMKEATKSMVTMGERGADLKSLVGILIKAINDLKTEITVLATRLEDKPGEITNPA